MEHDCLREVVIEPVQPRYPAAWRTGLLTVLAMLAFAGNSLLCRVALRPGHIDAAGFTVLRLLAAATVLWLLLKVRCGPRPAGDWCSATALFVYAAGFSFAYLTLPTGVGALILFGAVQETMIGYALWNGERFGGRQLSGLGAALAGLTGLLLPGATAPSLGGALLMLLAGVAWGVYSLRGRRGGDPGGVTAGNFGRAVLFGLLLGTFAMIDPVWDGVGIACAVVSGGLASGVGYILWYAVVVDLSAATAATVQLSVPVLAALGGVLLLGEPVTLRLLLASLAILGGVALFIAGQRPSVPSASVRRT